MVGLILNLGFRCKVQGFVRPDESTTVGGGKPSADSVNQPERLDFPESEELRTEQRREDDLIARAQDFVAKGSLDAAVGLYKKVTRWIFRSRAPPVFMGDGIRCSTFQSM